jgi:myo-inositol-1(or 4)-monophosphatase
MSSSSPSNTPLATDRGDESTVNLERVLKVAVAASKKAGEIILRNAGGADVSSRKANSRDLLTLIDPLCEEVIRETVLAEFPTHDFLGEEDVDPGRDASARALDAKLNSKEKMNEWLWIVDPIDGTSNFVRRWYSCV